jgi:hypothetical protein
VLSFSGTVVSYDWITGGRAERVYDDCDERDGLINDSRFCGALLRRFTCLLTQRCRPKYTASISRKAIAAEGPSGAFGRAGID